MRKEKAATYHGILLIALFSLAAFYVSDLPFVKSLSLSPLIVGIILGMLYANSLRGHLPDTWVPGIKFCTKQVLRTGIVLYGFRLTLSEVQAVGWGAVGVDALIILSTIGLGLLVGRLLHMDRDTALLTSTGSAICGAAAVLGAEPVVRGEGHKTAVAVSTVVIFGTLSMFLYPVLYRAGVLSGMSDMQVAVYTGSTLHEVAHVAAAGNAIDGFSSSGLDLAGVATITKMIRVMMLAPVLIVMAWCLRGRAAAEGGKARIAVPWFAFGFLAVILLNTVLQSVEALRADWLASLLYGKGSLMEGFDTFLLTMAMAALGAETSIDKFRKAGARPFLLAAVIYVWLVFGGYALTAWLTGC